jgi:microtubule-associated protein, RP/EB family
MADSTDPVIGMMDGAYFTGRKEILEWINSTLDLGVTKIESTCTGAIACQLLDAHFPGNVQMAKVNWEARNDYEYVNNYKILQAALAKLNISKTADIEKLSRGKYQDNLEFMQWFKGYCSNHSVAEGYDAVAARSKGKGAKRVIEIFGKPGTKVSTVKARRHTASGAMGAAVAASNAIKEVENEDITATSSSSSSYSEAPPPRVPPAPMTRSSSNSESRDKENGSSAAPSAARSSSTSTATTTANGNPRAMKAVNGPRASNANMSKPLSEDSSNATIKKLEEERSHMMMHIQGVERERDFFFEKLRNIEVLLQDREESKEGENEKDLASSIFKILYETNDDFVAPDEVVA